MTQFLERKFDAGRLERGSKQTVSKEKWSHVAFFTKANIIDPENDNLTKRVNPTTKTTATTTE
uniref:Uncharacterized protein n=1 Tax=Rhizophagus irregularis (strain DAOM 181602 / DAOM 197198 / MUCL 43194) TaxID=747089 RepID=U9UY98_RHIID